MIPFSGTGIMIPFWLGLSWLVVGFFYEERSFEDASFVAWILATAAIITALHGFQLVMSTRRPGHGAQRRSPWHDAFALIPVLIWPIIFAAGSVYYFLQ